VWDRHYQYYKDKDDEAALGGGKSYLAPACEIFEMRDMRKWDEERADAINEEMQKEKELLQDCIQKRKEAEEEKTDLKLQIKDLTNKVESKKVPTASDKEDNDALRDLHRDLAACEEKIDSLTATLNEPRFNYTVTKYKDGLLDFNEFKKVFDKLKEEAPETPQA